MKVSLKKSTRKNKKMVMIFEDKKGKETSIKKVHFGNKGSHDFTTTGDEDKKKAYLARHKPREDWTDPFSPGALSRWILWNKPTIKESFKDYGKRFKLKLNKF
tara:strand:+ start:1285 stop:1593 length:309 start_codon:yes stop_codon:yes gene_type:complete